MQAFHNFSCTFSAAVNRPLDHTSATRSFATYHIFGFPFACCMLLAVCCLLLVALTLELFACRNSCDNNLSTIVAAGNRCIRALHTRLAPAPPWRHRPVIICVVRSSKLSSGKRVMRLISSCVFASATSGLRSEESSVRSKLSKQGCTCASMSELRRASSSFVTPCRR